MTLRLVDGTASSQLSGLHRLVRSDCTGDGHGDGGGTGGSGDDVDDDDVIVSMMAETVVW